MKTLQKTLAAIFALLALALFAGCSSDSADSDDFLAGTTWTCEYESIDEDGKTYDFTATLYFRSGGNVTASYYNEDTEESDGEEDGTYSVSGSMVTVNLENSGELVFVYSSGKLEYLVIYTTTSTDLGDTITTESLAGTTWTYSKTYIEDKETYTTTIEFKDDGSVTLTYDTTDEAYEEYYDNTYTGGTYSVSDDGSTVTVTINGSNRDFVYSSGQLIRVSMTFEKAS